MEKDKDTEKIKEFFGKAKSFLGKIDEVVTEELKGNDMVNYLKDKAKDVQVKVNDVQEHVQEKIKVFTTEELEAEDKDSTLEIQLVLPGIEKEHITIDVEDLKLTIHISDKDVKKDIKKYWSVSKTNLFYDITPYGDSARVEETASKFENGILTITIPKKERIKDKKKITIL
jgi:HSP20 family molecular chaperone IbpA